MTNRKTTKRALVSSALAMLMCMTMLIGTTFAWFTDTASTSVNKIQAGTLDVDLQVKENGEWVSAEGKSLDFVKAAGHEEDTILWEPGCTYELPELRVVNKGNLALKYKVVITGINGDAKLNEAIDWYYSLEMSSLLPGATGWTEPTDPYKLENFGAEDYLYPEGIAQNARTNEKVFKIIGKMDKDAGNEYQGLSIESIAIAVIATQYTYEYDSNNNQYDKEAEYPTVPVGESLEDVFADANVNFGYNNTMNEPVVLDGKGAAIVENWTDAWINSNTTIKGVTFRNGAVFSLLRDNVTVILEDCTFYACDQSKLTYNGNNSLTNSGAGMCLNLEKSGRSGANFVVKNCTFIGENDNTLPAGGNKYNADGTINVTNKKRGHAIALDAICGGGTGTLESLLIEGCTIDGVRGNAIQLYGNTGTITIKDTNINSWAVNNTGVGYAVRGDFDENGSRTLTIENVYFGLNEIQNNDEFGHVKVGSFSGNTNGTRNAGTY